MTYIFVFVFGILEIAEMCFWGILTAVGNWKSLNET